MGHRITAVAIHDFKRVRTVEITPAADASIILLGGKNAQGKSSILDALTAALGGGRALPSEPIRRGAKEAEIVVEFDGGALSIQRVIGKKGSHLEVKNADGVVRSPQSMLDKLVGARTLDPLAFLALKPADQRAQLMKLIEGADRIDGLNAKREKAFDRRTEIGRDQKKAQGELDRLRAVEATPGTPIDVAALTAEKERFAALQREGDGLGNAKALASKEATSAQLRVEKTKATIAELENKLRIERELLVRDERELAAALEAEEGARCRLANAADAWAKAADRRAELDEQLAKASTHNRAVYEAEAHAKRLAEAEAAAEKLDADYQACSKAIEEIDRRKADLLSAAKLPVAELEVSDDGVTYRGLPFAQASAAERLRVSVALALAASPQLDDVWVRDAALVDEEGLALIADLAAAAGKRVWLERVGTADPGVIVIADGQVAA